MIRALRWLAWMGTTVAGLVLLSQPVGTQNQLAMSLAAMAAMIVLWLFLDGPRTRFVFLALGSLVVLRYILWRVTDTLPSPAIRSASASACCCSWASCTASSSCSSA